MIGRRKLVAALAGGTLFGLTGVAVTRSTPSIRFIGRRGTILALLDTATERVLIVLGERDDELLANTQGLTTVGNTRIDLVVASHSILASQAARTQLQTDVIPTLSMQASTSLPPIRGEITQVTTSTTLELGTNTSMRIHVQGSQEDHPDFLISIRSRNCQLLLASSSAALRMVENRSCELLAIPGSSTEISATNISPQLLVCNALDRNLEVPQMLVFPTDPSIVRIHDGRLSVRDDQLSF